MMVMEVFGVGRFNCLYAGFSTYSSVTLDKIQNPLCALVSPSIKWGPDLSSHLTLSLTRYANLFILVLSSGRGSLSSLPVLHF